MGAPEYRRPSNTQQLPALIWLASHDCDANAALDEAETMIRAYQSSPESTQMLAVLVRLHRKP